MIIKKIATLALTLILASAFVPMIVKAEVKNLSYLQYVKALDVIGQEIALKTASTGLCHCGGTRGETEYMRVQNELCPEHGPSCSGYQAAYTRTYYYCSNPNCGDNWYSSWCLYIMWHE